MAINTRERRQSVVVLGQPYMGPNTTPNASPDVEWRQEVGYSYPGIAPDTPPASEAALRTDYYKMMGMI